MEQRGWRLSVKKTFDRVVAGVGLVAVSPVLVGAAVAVRATIGAPILFRQTRPGYKAQPFEFLKFRTMTTGAGTDAERTTRVGRFLRATSIDELPQLVNVLRGELSLIGPRPLLMEYLDRYTRQEMRRHDVLPGITGLAAISGRNNLAWDERLRLDVEYVDRWSLWLDAEILLKTAYKVAIREGASGDVVTPEFRPTTSIGTNTNGPRHGGSA